jgi:hypothetical protein
MKFFVFRVTDVCDKRCETCCASRGARALPPDRLREKLVGIGAYCESRRVDPLVFLTGGEPFLYKATGGDGRHYSIVDLVAMVRRHLHGAGIVVKTSGWAPHPVLDRRFSELAPVLGGGPGEVRLGFNLFQQESGRSAARLSHMLELVLRNQDAIRIETIYDKENFRATFRVIEDVLSSFDVPRGASLQPPDPQVPYEFLIPVRGAAWPPDPRRSPDRMIRLSTMPAYAGLGRAASDRYYEAQSVDACARLQAGPDHLSYDPDLSVRHCNDAFADHAVAPFPASRFQSVEEEFDFLAERFARLNEHLASRNMAFGSRRERCRYCTHFVCG